MNGRKAKALRLNAKKVIPHNREIIDLRGNVLGNRRRKVYQMAKDLMKKHDRGEEVHEVKIPTNILKESPK